MSDKDLQILHLKNKVHQLEQLLEQERVKCFGLRRLFAELRAQGIPLLRKLEKVKGLREE